MLINSHCTVTKDTIHCTVHGALTRERLCEHAPADEVSRTMSLLNEYHRRNQAPGRKHLTDVSSSNHNGTYALYQLDDGSLACTCLPFLFQSETEGVRLRSGAVVPLCKHLRSFVETHPDEISSTAATLRPTSWQKMCLAALTHSPLPVGLTNDQAYFIVHHLLAVQGVAYLEIEELIKNHGRFSLLPIYQFGIEFEGTNVESTLLARELNRVGLTTQVQDYNHTTQSIYKIVPDGSVQGVNQFELVTPKLFGAPGFNQISTLCRTVKNLEGQVNASCGLHVHVSAWNLDLRDIKRLVRVWKKLEAPVIHYLIPPSRRNGQYCADMTDEVVDFVRRLRSLTSLGRISCRYFSLNLRAWTLYNTIEIRNHAGSFSPRKVTSWVIFLLMLVSAVKRGLDADQIDPSWQGVRTAIGLDCGTSLIRKADQYLTRRHAYWSNGQP